MSIQPSETLLSPNLKISSLRSLREECYDCTRCVLCRSVPPLVPPKKPYVFGAGKVTARVVLVGQNPGLNEVLQGRPFIGASGRSLDAALSEAQVDRKKLYITNGVLCYSNDNTLPPDESVESCKYFLRAQLDIIAPDAVVVMGKSAARSFGFGDRFSVNMCKTVKPWKTEVHDNVYFTVHPAYTIYSKGGFEVLVNTLKGIKDLV